MQQGRLKMKLKDKIKKHRKQLQISFAFVLLLTSIYKIFNWYRTTATDNAYIESDIAMVSAEVHGDVIRVFVQDNQKVNSGDVIAKIDDTIYKAQLSSAEANLESAKFGLEISEQQFNLEQKNLQKAEELLGFARVNLKLSKADFERGKKLHADNFSSKQNFDKSKIAYEKSKYEFSQAELSLDMSKHKLDILKTEKLSKISQINALQAQYNIALEALNNTDIKSPIDGTITATNLKVGNYARAGMPMFFVIPNKKHIKANFKETQIENIAVGQEVTIKIDSISGKKFQGRVKSIYPATGSKFALIPPDNATGNFTKIIQRVPVIIEFIDISEYQDKIKPGMSCEVEVFKDIF